jgi:hypothetical protein
MTLKDVQQIRQFLKRMQAADPRYSVFGSDLHNYGLGTPLTESELRAFEQEHQIQLPADYRFFFREAGNGAATRSTQRLLGVNCGAGPDYGLFPLDEAVANCDLRQTCPFPGSSTGEYHPIKEEWGDEEPWPGMLEIGYSGCDYFTYLVVNGPAYGTVWQASLTELLIFNTGLSFEEWYRRWMESLIRTELPRLTGEFPES